MSQFGKRPDNLGSWLDGLARSWKVRDFRYHERRYTFGGFPEAVEHDQERVESVRFRVTISIEGETDEFTATLSADEANIIRVIGSDADNGTAEIGPIYLEIKAKHALKPSEAV